MAKRTCKPDEIVSELRQVRCRQRRHTANFYFSLPKPIGQPVTKLRNLMHVTQEAGDG